MQLSRRWWAVLPVAGLVAVAGLSDAGPASAVSELPPGAATVQVTSGAVLGGVDAVIHPSGAITGRLTKQGSGVGVADASVYAVDRGGTVRGNGYTDGGGNFVLQGLNPGTYFVCAFYVGGTRQRVPFGYVPQCRGSSTPALNYTAPRGSTTTVVRAGRATHGVNFAVPAAGAISGIVRSARGAVLSDVFVSVLLGDRRTVLASVSSGPHGYQLSGIPPGGGYRVCFGAVGATGGRPGTGYLSLCWRRTAWTGFGAAPAGAAAVSVRRAQVTGGVDVRLPVGGAIAGVIRSSGRGHRPVPGGYALAFAGRTIVAAAGTDAHGAYRITGLPAGTYTVCAAAEKAPVPYGGRCYDDVPWNLRVPPAGTQGLTVRAGRVRGGVDFALRALPPPPPTTGVLAGTVRGPGGALLDNAEVHVFLGSVDYGTSYTAADGSYSVELPGSAAGYSVCVKAGRTTKSDQSQPATGWSGACFATAPWDGGMSPPAGATLVPVRPGNTRTGVDVTLGLGGALGGTVTAQSGGAPIADVRVYVINSRRELVQQSLTQSDGSYFVDDLAPAATGYTVCFDAQGVTYAAGDGLGFLNQCYDGKDWFGHA